MKHYINDVTFRVLLVISFIFLGLSLFGLFQAYYVESEDWGDLTELLAAGLFFLIVSLIAVGGIVYRLYRYFKKAPKHVGDVLALSILIINPIVILLVYYLFSYLYTYE